MILSLPYLANLVQRAFILLNESPAFLHLGQAHCDHEWQKYDDNEC